MKTKLVNRYYCEFCKKSGCSAPHMAKHERRCTMNPKRECGVCGLVGSSETRPIRELTALLPDPDAFIENRGLSWEGFSDEITPAANATLPELRDATENCPACILAAIRQRGIPVHMVTDFGWTSEMEAVWAEVNKQNAEHY